MTRLIQSWNFKNRVKLTELKTPDFFAQLHSLEWKDWDRSIGQNSWKVLENQHHFLTSCIGDVLSVNASRTKLLLTSTERCSNHEFLLEKLKNCRDDRNLTQKLSRGHTIRNVMRKSAWKYFVSWRIKKKSSCTKSQLHVWPTRHQ